MSNEEVLNLEKEKRCLYSDIKRRHDRLIGHTLRHEGLLGKLSEDTVEGRKRKGGQKLKYVKQTI